MIPSASCHVLVPVLGAQESAVTWVFWSLWNEPFRKHLFPHFPTKQTTKLNVSTSWRQSKMEEEKKKKKKKRRKKRRRKGKSFLPHITLQIDLTTVVWITMCVPVCVHTRALMYVCTIWPYGLQFSLDALSYAWCFILVSSLCSWVGVGKTLNRWLREE